MNREITEVPTAYRYKLKSIFNEIYEFPIISSVLGGYMGKAWTDSLENPTLGQLTLGNYTLFAGSAESPSALTLIRNIEKPVCVLPSSPPWHDLIMEHYNNVLVIERKEFDGSSLGYDHIRQFTEHLPQGYELKRIDVETAKKMLEEKWSEDFIRQFDSPEDFYDRGIGFCILHEGKIVSGASSYSVFKGGIELEGDTHKDYRQKGLVTCALAKLLLYCLENCLYPSWDTANEISVHMGLKFGYKLKKVYKVLRIEK